MRFGGFDWDGNNLPKCLGHGVSLEQIEALFANDVFVIWEGVVNNEPRVFGFGEVGERRIFCAFTWRGDRIRPISIRFMHAKEVRLYVKESPESGD